MRKNMYNPPLSIYFVWHPADSEKVKPLVDFCSKLLQRDSSKPFSRSMNLPIFNRTSIQNKEPEQIKLISKKTVVFSFIGENIVADKAWSKYISGLPDKQCKLIPIALDKTALNLKFINHLNFIRSYNFEQCYLEDYLFISIAHEIYRYALNEDFEENKTGKQTALKIFLSHAKDGKQGIKVAEALKEFIDKSVMNRFFDATDIGIGYKFNKEIEDNIKDSTLIAIHSDIYSSRYWCQKEILCAKELSRPMIAVDCLEEFEDRRFPFAANIPGVHISLNRDYKVSEKDLLRILSLALLETIRFFYSKFLLEEYKRIEWIPNDVQILSRPPEISDLGKIFNIKTDKVFKECKLNPIIYPEPPVYSEELSFLKEQGCRIETPLAIGDFNLTGKKIGISISNPSMEELIKIGQNGSHLSILSQDIARHILARHGMLIYGGDLRKDGFTKFLFEEALILQARLISDSIYIENYISWPIYVEESSEIINWKAKYNNVAEMIEIKYPDDVKDLIVNDRTFLHPVNKENSFIWTRCLTEMRNEMINNCDVRISAGGTSSEYKGKMPGVLEEIIIALEKNKPLFLLGGFGGITSKVCDLILHKKILDELTVEWQIDNNKGYKDLLNYASSRQYNYVDDYSSAINTLTSSGISKLNNGLNEKENYRLFETPFIDEAVHLLLKGLKNLYGK